MADKMIKYKGGFKDGKSGLFALPLRRQTAVTVCLPYFPCIPPLGEYQGRPTITTHREGYILNVIHGEQVYVYCHKAFKNERTHTRMIA